MSDEKGLVVHSGGCPICGFRMGAHAVSCPSNPNNQADPLATSVGEETPGDGVSTSVCMICNYDDKNHHPACSNASPAE